ncbi:MAG: hypothetical protein ABI867_21985 [Kofleriaceae bacterium]
MRVMVMIVMVGCGSSDATAPDATTLDTSPPDAPMELPCTPTHGDVIVDGPTAQASVITVLVHDSAGTVLSRSEPLGSDATVTVDVPSCGMVTIVDHNPVDRDMLLTWVGVQPGDHLTDVRRRLALVPYSIEFTVGTVAGATQYIHSVACAGSSSLATSTAGGLHTEVLQCPATAATVSILATAKTAAGATFARALAVPLSQTGTTTVDLGAYQSPTQSLVASVQNAAGFDRARLVLFQGVTPRLFLDSVETTGSTGMLGLPAIGNLGGDGSMQLEVSGTDKFLRLAKVATPIPLTFTVDALVDLLPTLDVSLVSNPTRPTLTWTGARPFIADFATVGLSLAGAPNGGLHFWTVVAPPHPGSIQLPEVPADLLPTGGISSISLSVDERAEVSTYDVARNALRELITQPSTNDARSTTARP